MENEIIVVSAVWCPSCLILKKQLKELQQKYQLNFKLLDYDLDEEEVNKYNVGNILPVMIYQDKRIIGEKKEEEILTFLKDCDLI